MNDATQQVEVNGAEITVPAPITVAGLLAYLQVDLRHVAVEQNRQIVAKADYPAASVRAGDRLEIVTLVGGG